MGKVIEFGRRDKLKLPERFWQQEYTLLSQKKEGFVNGLPYKSRIPSGAEISFHPGSSAHLLIHEQLLRVFALSRREIREAVFFNAGKILKCRYTYNSHNSILKFKHFLKLVSLYVKRYEAVVLDNLGMRCWLPEEWLHDVLGCF